MERIMKRYDIRVRYSFEGTYTVAAEDRDEAKRMVNDDCGLVLGGDIHTTRDDDEVLDWDFCIHPRHADSLLAGKRRKRKFTVRSR